MLGEEDDFNDIASTSGQNVENDAIAGNRQNVENDAIASNSIVFYILPGGAVG